MPNLGPYQWSLLFWGEHGASEWMGDEVDRDKAATVKVKEGRITTYNTKVGPGTTVTGQVFTVDGVTPAGEARIVFVNAKSADNMGVGNYYLPLGPNYTAQVKGRQRVKITYSTTVDGVSYQGWIGGTSFADAAVFTIPDDGEFTLDLAL